VRHGHGPVPVIGRARAVAHRVSAPRDSSPVRRRNFEVIQLDSVAMGLIGAATTFLPVFIVRLGGGALATGILTLLPALGGLLFGVPFGRLMERRGRVIRWYSVSRFVTTWAYAASALIAVVAAPDLVVPLCLVAWAIASLPQTIGQVTFPIVMDGAAGPQGRVDLLGRRWALMGLASAIAVAIAGLVLEVLGMPTGYELVLASGTVFGIACYHWSNQIVLDDDRPAPPPSANTAGLPARQLLRMQRPFTEFVTRKAVFVAGVRLVTPLLPLFYVKTIHASDAWIGLIAMAQGLALVAGYVFWRKAARGMSRMSLLVWTLGVYGALPAALALCTTPEPVAVLTAIGMFFGAGSDLALFDELMDLIPRDQKVTFAGVDYAVTNLAGIIAPLVGAAIVAVVSIELGLVAGAALSLAGLGLFLRAGRRSGTEAASGGPAASAIAEG
jgi:MFS family permease